MTDSKELQENTGDMDPRFENFAAYALDALDTEAERSAVESLIESDNEAQAELNDLTDAAGLLAIAVPPVAPPAHLKTSILRLAEQESSPSSSQVPITTPATSWWQRTFQSGYAVSAAAAVLVIVATAVLGFQNNQLSNEIDTLRADLRAESVTVASLQSDLSTTLTDSETRVATMKTEMTLMEDEFETTAQMVVHQEEMVSELAIANDALKQALRDQSWLTYVAMKEGYQVESWLANTQQVASANPNASGLIAVRLIGNEAVFQVHGLEQPQPGFAYTLWLMGTGAPLPVAQFEVSEIGSATVAFLLPAPLGFFSSVVVTQEQVNGIGNDPTGTMVLFAETD
jgi:hypothetical protein